MVVVDEVYEAVKAEFLRRGAYFLNDEEKDKVRAWQRNHRALHHSPHHTPRHPHATPLLCLLTRCAPRSL